MAKAALAKHAPVAATGSVRKHSNRALAKVKEELAKVKASSRANRKESMPVSLTTALVVGATAFGVGWAQAQQKAPATLGGVNAPLVVGAVGLGLPYLPFVKGAVSRISSQVGVAALAVGALQIGAGSPVMSGDGWNG